jgi:predicted nucleic acid-binding protein
VTERGLLDSNLFIHALYRRDPLYRQAREIVERLETGADQGWIDPLVVHELLYTLEHLHLMATRQERHTFARALVTMPGAACEHRDWLLEALDRWSTADVSFVDAWLWAQARQRRLPICTSNARHFRGVRQSF